MSWATRFRIRQYLAGSLWVMPLIGGVLGALLGSADVLVDRTIHLPAEFTYSAATASTVLSAIVGAVAALTGFVVTVTVLVVQMATGTFSARYMRLWYRDRVLKALLALLIGTLSFAFALLRHVETSFRPNLGTSIAGLLLLIGLMLFVVFLDRFLHRLRPVAVAVLVSDYLHRDFRRLVAMLAAPEIYWGGVPDDAEPPLLVARCERRGAIQAIDVDGLLGWARTHDLLVVVRHPVGDFVPAQAVLVEAYGDGVVEQRDAERLRRMVVLGVERTIEQDPAFAIRIMVDIADKALSAAINDPTTAVQVLNYLADSLRLIGTTDVSGSRFTGTAATGRGLVVPVRSWQAYLALATTEIREYGSSSIQVMRRMRSMLEELLQEVLEEHRPAVRDELARLDATVARSFGDSVDLDRAATADVQGIGGVRFIQSG
ncbi:MAG: DUF2254 family protein [Solirubrobacteraceae bacterium]